MNEHKYAILVFVSVFLALSFSCQAQSQSSDSLSLKEGSWAIQFGIAGNFTLTSFQGSTIGAKYQLSENNAIRGGITLNGSTIDGPYSYSHAIGDTNYGSSPGSTSRKIAGVTFVLQYLWYMNPNGPVHLYFGFGPLAAYSYSHNSTSSSTLEYVYNQYLWVEDLNESTATQWSLGGSATFGVEWFACHWLSLRADYNEGIQYQWNSSSYKQGNSSNYQYYFPNSSESSASTKGWSLSSGGASFGLNVYL